MKVILLSFALTFVTVTTFAQVNKGDNYQLQDTVSLQVNGTNAYYQKVVKLDSNIMESIIYVRALQFMASKNFQQNYGYEQEGKLIFTTSQDLNVNDATDDNEVVEPYTVQFAIIIDMKNKRYRYTVNNVTFYLPTDNGNRRLSLYDIYKKETGDSRRISKEARKLITSFEKYIAGLTDELHENIVQKARIHNTKF